MEGSYWHLVDRARAAATCPVMHRTVAQQQREMAQRVNNADAEKLCARLESLSSVSEARKVLPTTIYSEQSSQAPTSSFTDSTNMYCMPIPL